MLNFNSIMIGSSNPKALADFYAKVFDKKADWHDEKWYGWQIGDVHVTIGEHSEVKGKSKEPQRIMLNMETADVKAEFERIKKAGAKVIKAPYEMQNMWIATLADIDGNFFQLMSPWDSGMN